MRTVLYILIIILTFLAPVQRLDVAKLQPVEAIAIYTEQDTVIIKTDTEEHDKDMREEYRAWADRMRQAADRMRQIFRSTTFRAYSDASVVRLSWTNPIWMWCAHSADRVLRT